MDSVEKFVNSRVKIYKECYDKIAELKCRMLIAKKLTADGKSVNIEAIQKELAEVQRRMNAILT